MHAQNVLRRLVKALKKPPDKNTQKAPNASGRRVGGKKELFAFPATQLEVSQLELPALPAWRWQAVFLNLQGFLCATNTKAVKIILHTRETTLIFREFICAYVAQIFSFFLQK